MGSMWEALGPTIFLKKKRRKGGLDKVSKLQKRRPKEERIDFPLGYQISNQQEREHPEIRLVSAEKGRSCEEMKPFCLRRVCARAEVL